MAATTEDTTAALTGKDIDVDSGVAPASTFSTSGAPVQIVPDVDPDHPAVDNDPRKNTTPEMNKIDFNDPRPTEVVRAEEAEAAAKAAKTKS